MNFLISKKITPLAEEIKHCDNIMIRFEKIKEQEEKKDIQDKEKYKKNNEMAR